MIDTADLKVGVKVRLRAIPLKCPEQIAILDNVPCDDTVLATIIDPEEYEGPVEIQVSDIIEIIP